MSAATLYAKVGLLHRSSETVQAIQRHVLRLRRSRVISAERAAQTLYDLDTLDFPDQLPDQLGFLLAPSNKDLFPDFASLVRGTVIDRAPGRSRAFRDALADYIAMFCGEHGMLPA